VEVRPLGSEDGAWVTETTSQQWGLPVVSISGPHDPGELPGFVAVEGATRLGVVTYRAADDECEVVTLHSFRPNRGVGTALLHAVKAVADEKGLRLWLITTDENLNAIRFYEHRGMTRRAVHHNFVDVVHTYKPQPTAPGARGSGYRDAIEFSF
jgi:DNA-3-methyladenine glycosylase I